MSHCLHLSPTAIVGQNILMRFTVKSKSLYIYKIYIKYFSDLLAVKYVHFCLSIKLNLARFKDLPNLGGFKCYVVKK